MVIIKKRIRGRIYLYNVTYRDGKHRWEYLGPMEPLNRVDPKVLDPDRIWKCAKEFERIFYNGKRIITRISKDKLRAFIVFWLKKERLSNI